MGCTIDQKSSIEGKKVKVKEAQRRSLELNKFNYNLPKLIKDFKNTKINDLAKSLTKYYKNQKLPINKDELFIDPLFPPNDNSIFGITKNGSNFDKDTNRVIESSKYFNIKKNSTEWLRPNEIFDGPYSLFEGKIEVGDTIQGAVGDCYFLSAISAMAEFPHMICQIFKNLQISKNGLYEIALRLNGQWKIVIIDDYFPCNKETKIPWFCKPNGNEIWAMLLEKAWAKVNGGYINIDAGFTIEVLNTLTPFPSDIILHEDYEPEKLWKILALSDMNDNILTCMTKSDDSIKKVGLIPGHSCTLVSCFERKVRDKNLRLLKIRNPWGYFEWSGKFSDGSKEWDEETKKIFEHSLNKEDGIFWIEYNDFLNYFSGTEICKSKKTLCVKNIIIPKDRVNYPNIFHLNILNKCTVYISILRKSYRFNREILSNEEIICNLIILKILPNYQMQIISSNSSNKRNCVLSLELDPGDYLVYFHVDYNKGVYDKIRKYSIDIACSEFFKLYEKGIDKNYKFLQKIVKKYVETEITLSPDKNSCQHIIEHISSGLLETTYGFIYLKNISDIQHTIQITPHLKNFYFIEENFNKLNDPSYDEELSKFIILPNQSLILLTNTIKYYDLAEMNVDYKKFHTKSSEQYKNVYVTNEISSTLKHFLADPISSKCYEYVDYTFIYNAHQDFDFSNIIKIINCKEIAIKKYKKKYPEDMDELLKLPPLDDNEDVIFRDRCYIGKDYYFGETHYASMERHGRGKYYWDSDQVIFYGYSIKGQFNGQGKFIYPNGEIHEGNLINGKIVGKGRLFKEGIWKDTVFPI